MAEFACAMRVKDRRLESIARRPLLTALPSSRTVSQLRAVGSAPVSKRVASPISESVITGRDARSRSTGGLPPRLRVGVEALSGMAMDDVRVHRNSSEPAKLGALAFTRGTQIHLGPGQDQHLPHEAWHVVQQKQGRVQATDQFRGQSLNSDACLETEADRMGRIATEASPDKLPAANIVQGLGVSPVVQRQAAPPVSDEQNPARQLQEVSERLKQPNYPGRDRDLAIKDGLLTILRMEEQLGDETPPADRPLIGRDPLSLPQDPRVEYGERVIKQFNDELERKRGEENLKQAEIENETMLRAADQLDTLRRILIRPKYNRYQMADILSKCLNPRARSMLRHHGLEWPRRGPTQASVLKALDNYEYELRKKTTGTGPVMSELTDEDLAAIAERDEKQRILEAQVAGYGATIGSFLGGASGWVSRWFTEDEETIADFAQLGATAPAIVPKGQPTTRTRRPSRRKGLSSKKRFKRSTARTSAKPRDLRELVSAFPPINARHRGKVVKIKSGPLKGKSVRYDALGFPDFSPWSIATVKIKMRGNRSYTDPDGDFGNANVKAGYSRNAGEPSGYTWHHHQDRTTMQLVPTDIHDAFRHSGGVWVISHLGEK